MSIQGYKIFRWYRNKLELVNTLDGTQPRKELNKLRLKGYLIKKIIRRKQK